MMPNFLIIGAAKAGTTSLYNYLQQHPEVYMCPLKEPKFFSLEGNPLTFAGPGDQRANRHTVTRLDEYQALFAKAHTQKAVGEKSPIYLYDAETPQRIKHYLPDVKLIVIMRNPIERAYSNYLHMVRDSRESHSNFLDALEAEEQRIQQNWAYGWHYRQMGYYATQLTRYYEHFDPAQIQVYLHEDLRNEPQQMLQSLFRFIGVDPTFMPDMSLQENKTGIPVNAKLQLFLKYEHPLKDLAKPLLPKRYRERLRVNVLNRNLRKAPKLDPTVRDALKEEYRSDILHLETLIQRDLRAWLS
ncbi:MAG: sulfotransferase [Caldilineaceae bacterium]|nr:sulfotransferase [Caldilineaceae bacterium]